MVELWHFIVKSIIDHSTAIGTALLTLFFVAVSCMPKPGEIWNKQTLYKWIYETLQTVLPVNRFHSVNTTQETLPVQSVKEEVGQKALSETMAQFSKK